VFARGSYQIAFMMYGEPPTSIGVAFDQAEAFAPLARVVEKTGWCLLDPDAKAFVDIAASRSAGRTVLVGDEMAAAPAVATPPRARTGASSVPRLIVAAGAGLLIAGAAYGAAWKLTDGRVSMKLPASILATQASSTRFEKYPDRLVRRKHVLDSLPAPYRANAIVEQLVDVQLASRAYYNFVDGRYTSPELLSNEGVWSRFQMPAFLPASFAQRQRAGYDFEFRGVDCEESEPGWPECTSFVYIARPVKAAEGAGTVFALFSADDKVRVTTDGRVPTREDSALTASPQGPGKAQ
jgi:hypothetical protein